MKQFRVWIIYFGSSIVFFTIALLLSLFLFHQSDIPQRSLKSVLEYQLDNLLLCDVEIGDLSGNFLTHMQLSGIKLLNHPDYPEETIISVTEADVYFNPLRFLFNKNLLSIVKHISLNGVNLNVIKDRDKQLNLSKLLSKDGSLGMTDTGSFATVTLHDLFLHYRDESKWEKDGSAMPFVEVFYFKHTQSFFEDGKVVLSANEGIVASSRSPIVFFGEFDFTDGFFEFDFLAELDLDRWGAYILKKGKISISHGIAQVRGRCQSRDTHGLERFPFWYSFEIDPKDAHVVFSFSDIPFTHLNGRLLVNFGKLSTSNVLDAVSDLNDDQLQSVWQTLEQTDFLDKDGQINGSKLRGLDAEDLPASLYPFQSQILQLLRNPPHQLFLDDMRGMWRDIPLDAHGVVNLSSKYLDLIVRSRSFSFSEFPRLFPALSNWELSGVGDTDLTIFGSFRDIRFEGLFFSDLLNYYGVTLDEFWLNCSFQDKVLIFDSRFNRLYDGDFSFFGEIDLRSDVPTLDFSFYGVGMSAQSVFSRSDQVTGQFGFSASLSGDVEDYDSKIVLYPQQLRAFNQFISMADADIQFFVSENQKIQDIDGRFWLNGGMEPIRFTGSLVNLVTANFELGGEDVWFRDVTGVETNRFGVADIFADIRADLIPTFWESPLVEMCSDFRFDFKNFPFEDHVFDRVQVEGVFDCGKLQLSELLAFDDRQRLKVTGRFSKFVPDDMYLDFENVLISNTNFFQRWIPDVLKPLGGRLDLTMNLGRDVSSHEGVSHDDEFGDDHLLGLFSASGDFELKDGYIRQQSVSRLSSGWHWQESSLSFDYMKLFQKDSFVSVTGTLIPEGGVSLSISEDSYITMEDFEFWTSPFGEFDGKIKLSGLLQGTVSSPDIVLDVELHDFSTPHLAVDSLSGLLAFNYDRLVLTDWQIRDKSNFFSLSGYLDMETFRSSMDYKLSDLDYEVQILAQSSELESLISMLDGLRQDFRYRVEEENNLADDYVRDIRSQSNSYQVWSGLDVSQNVGQKVPLVSAGNRHKSLTFYDAMFEHYQVYNVNSSLRFKQFMKGTLSGYCNVKSRLGQNPLLDVELKVQDLYYRFVNADQLHVSLQTDNADVGYRMGMTNGRISSIPFDRFHSEGVFDQQGILHITETGIVSDDHDNLTLVSGTFPLQGLWDESLREYPIQLAVHLEQNDVAILSFLHPNITRLFNRGVLDMTLSGSLLNPILDANLIDFNGGGVYLKNGLITSPILYQSGDVVLKNNVFHFSDLELSWIGEDTLNKYNTIVANGTVRLDGLSFIDLDLIKLSMNLDLDPTELSLNIPELYSGELDVFSFRVSGDYLVGVSPERQRQLTDTIATLHESGPILSGRVLFENGDISMPQVGRKIERKPSWLFDLDVMFGNDVSVVGGVLGDSLLAGVANYLDIQLSSTDQPLRLSGSLNAPKVDNVLTLSGGSMTFLNRGFELLDFEKQTVFFEDYQFRIQPHIVSFQQEILADNTLRLNPHLTLSAFTVIESPTTEEGSFHSAVVMLVDGSIYNLEEIVFEKYNMTQLVPQRGDLDYVRSLQFLTDGSNQDQARETFEVLELLVPEFVGDSQNRTRENTQDILSAVGENQINSYLKRRILRPIEREIANSVGLYDLRVDYNLGRALIRGVGDAPIGQHTDSVGVSLVKGLTDNLFLKVRTDLELSPENTNSFENSNVSLEYNLSRNLSLSYSNGRERYRPESNPKFSLRYLHDF